MAANRQVAKVRGRRVRRWFFGLLAVSAALQAIAHYPSLSTRVVHHPLAALPWPAYLLLAVMWTAFWREAGRGR